MEPNPDAQVLAELLNLQRDTFNARFALARSRWRALSPREWKEVLAESVAPLVFEAQQTNPDRAHAVAEAAYEAALELLAREQLGPRATGAMAVLWRGVLPQVVGIVASEPSRVLNRACNALLEMQQHRLEAAWVGRLRSLASSAAFAGCDAEQFERSLLVLAWRCGLAHARIAALKYLREMPFELARALIGAPDADEESWPSLLGRLEREPFFNPSQAQPSASLGEPSLKIVAQLGDWEAWGGAMAGPPRVLRRNLALWAWSGQAWWRLHADAFGATLSPARFEVPPEQMPAEMQQDQSCGSWKLQVQKQVQKVAGESAPPDGSNQALQVTHGPNAAYGQAQQAVLRGFDGVLWAASDDHLLAFTSRLSMRIFVVARST